jgi:cell division protein ZapA
LAQVTVKVNGYAYTVGCEDGQESHLQAMSTQVDSRVESIKALGGNAGEARLLLLAALLMADEIHDLKIELDLLRRATGQPPRSGSNGKSEPQTDPEVAKRLGKLATRAEQIAASLERP